MKSVLFLLSAFAALAASAASQYQFESGIPGRSNGSLNILEDVASITLHTNFGSVGNSGRVGYYVYTDDPANARQGAVTFSKRDGAIKLSDLHAGEKVGFFLVRSSGSQVSRFNFYDNGDDCFLAFRKNGGHGRDEWMLFHSISVQKSSGPTGQPLPGVLLSLAAGAAVLGLRRKIRAARKTA